MRLVLFQTPERGQRTPGLLSGRRVVSRAGPIGQSHTPQLTRAAGPKELPQLATRPWRSVDKRVDQAKENREAPEPLERALETCRHGRAALALTIWKRGNFCADRHEPGRHRTREGGTSF